MNVQRMISGVVASTLAAFVVAASAVSAQDDRPGVGVFPFDNGGSIDIESSNLDNLRVGLQSMLMTELSQSTDLRLVDRASRNALLQEQDLFENGRVDASSAARLGKLIGARYAIFGAFTQIGPFRIDARIVDTETGELLRARSVDGELDETYANLVSLAADLVSDIDLQRLDVEPLPAQQTEQRQTRRVPGAALVLYARATAARDAGDLDRAREALKLLTTRFPDYTEAQEELEQLDRGTF